MPVSGIWAAAETNQRQAKKPGNRKVGKRYHNAAKCKGPSGAATIKEIPHSCHGMRPKRVKRIKLRSTCIELIVGHGC